MPRLPHRVKFLVVVIALVIPCRGPGGQGGMTVLAMLRFDDVLAKPGARLKVPQGNAARDRA